MRSKTLGTLERLALIGVVLAAAGTLYVYADDDHVHFFPGNLIVSRSVYDNNAGNVTVGMVLPPNCASTAVGCPKKGGKATNDGSLPGSPVVE